MIDNSALAASLVEKYALDQTSTSATPITGVDLVFNQACVPRAPLMYHSGVIIIVSGRKRVFLDGAAHSYDQHNYLTLGLPLPMECEADASGGPIFAIYVAADPDLVRDVALETDIEPESPDPSAPAVTAAALSIEMADAVQRLMTQLCSDSDAKILGPGTKREIIYRAMQGSAGWVLRGLVNRDSHTSRVSQVIQTLQANCAHSFSVEDMARIAGMSVSVFHRAFREATGSTPLQYLKKTRLAAASTLIIHEDYRIGEAAHAVGYESAAQFSRDFKSHYGVRAVDAKSMGYSFFRARHATPLKKAS